MSQRGNTGVPERLPLRPHTVLLKVFIGFKFVLHFDNKN